MRKSAEQLEVLSVVIPARDEEGCIASTVEHLHLELQLHGIAHEIIVVYDGSTDRTWEILQDVGRHVAELKPVQNLGLNGFGRAISKGLDALSGNAAVIMMADESDDPRDVVPYWKNLQEGYDCVFVSLFVKGGGSQVQAFGKTVCEKPLPAWTQRHHQCLQGLSQRSDRGHPPGFSRPIPTSPWNCPSRRSCEATPSPRFLIIPQKH
jgi:glycosyltransferase involved in cell wall biosynthesis